MEHRNNPNTLPVNFALLSLVQNRESSSNRVNQTSVENAASKPVSPPQQPVQQAPVPPVYAAPQLFRVDFQPGGQNKLTWIEIRDQAAKQNRRLPLCSELQKANINNGDADTWVPVSRVDGQTGDWCQIGKHPSTNDRYISHLDRFGPTAWGHVRGDQKFWNSEQHWRPSYYYAISNESEQTYPLCRVDLDQGPHNKLTWIEIRDRAASCNQRLPTVAELAVTGVNNGTMDTWVPVSRIDGQTGDWCEIGKHPRSSERYYSHLDRFGPTKWGHVRGDVRVFNSDQHWRPSYYFSLPLESRPVQQVIKIDFPPGGHNKLTWVEIASPAASQNMRLPTCGELQVSGVNNGNTDTWVPVSRADGQTGDWCQIGKHPTANDRYFSHLDRFGPTAWGHLRGDQRVFNSEQHWRPSYYYAIINS